MDYLSELIRRTKISLFLVLLVDNALLVGGWWLGHEILNLNGPEIIGLVVGIALLETTLIATTLGSLLMQPVKALWQTILHLSPQGKSVAAPQPGSVHYGQELVTTLSTQIYQLATAAEHSQPPAKPADGLHTNFVANNLPLPLLVLDASETIQFANSQAADYLGLHVEDLIGKNVYAALDMSFPSTDTFDKWLNEAKASSATASKNWQRVRLNTRDGRPVQLFDLAAYYNRSNPQHIETMLVLFDHTQQYSQDDQAVSFIALSVHELRTPLTLLRGYIEAFEEELDGKLTPELTDFMNKMGATAQQLTAFVNNILNVARVDDDQLQLQLQEADWPTILKNTLDTMALRARVRGITLNYSAAPGLPTVGVDHLSIQEVINNLVDNAIKYSGKSTVINVETHLTNDGLVETTVRDFGVGIPTSLVPNLFTKFYRDHRNRAQIGGTGLGLYLCKAIVTAHGGNIWVRSHEGEGSTFGFTVLPYAKLAAELKSSGNQEIVRGAHGWIKNHSLYRR